MIHACRAGKIEKVKRKTLDRFKNTSRRGWSCILMATDRDHIELVKYLIQEGYEDLNTRRENAFSKACESGNLEIVKILLENFKYRDFEFNDAFYYAVIGKNLEIIKMIIERVKSPERGIGEAFLRNREHIIDYIFDYYLGDQEKFDKNYKLFAHVKFSEKNIDNINSKKLINTESFINISSKPCEIY